MKIISLCYNFIHFIMYPARVRSSSLGFGYQRWDAKLVIGQLASVYNNTETKLKCIIQIYNMPRGFVVQFRYPQQDLRHRVRDEAK